MELAGCKHLGYYSLTIIFDSLHCPDDENDSNNDSDNDLTFELTAVKSENRRMMLRPPDDKRGHNPRLKGGEPLKITRYPEMLVARHMDYLSIK